MRLALAFIMFAPLAQAQDVCLPVPDHASEITALLDDLRVSRDATEAEPLASALWDIWKDAPDEKAQALLDKGEEQRNGFDLLGSRDTLDSLVDYCPDYAEGYNQRAFTNFLRRDFAAALVDLDKALAIQPTHFGALSGKALTLIGLGRNDEAQEVLKAAIALHPWMNERSLLIEPPGQDI